jgi:hypothetical protein
MESALEFLNQPIVVTLVTLTFGGYFISLIAERRARKNKLRDEAIDFITEAGDAFNQFVPHVYGLLRRGTIEWNQTLDDELKTLFSKRMRIQVGSQAYLHSEIFHVQYFQLLDEVTGVVQCIGEIESAGESDKIRQKIRDNRNNLIRSWNLADEAIPPSHQEASGELILWLDAVIHRMTALLVASLNSVLRNGF